MELLECELARFGPTGTVERLCRLENEAELEDRIDALVELARGRALSDPALANAALDMCQMVGRRLQRQDLQPHADYIRARIELIGGDPDRALALIERARAGWLAIDRPIDAFRTDLGRMNVLDDLGHHGEAVRVGEDLLVDLDRLDADEPDGGNSTGWLRAAVQENLGAAYGYTGRHHEAMAAYARAEAAYREVGDSADQARCRANRGVEQVAMGYALDGRESIAEAARMFLEIDDRYSYAKCQGHLADAELLLGWYTACLDHITEARAVLTELDATTESVRLALAACRAYLSLNLWGEAIDVAAEAERQLSELGLAHDLAEARFLLATAYAAVDQPERAFDHLNSVIAGAEASDDGLLRLRALTLRSRILAATDSGAEAERSAREAVEAAGAGHWPSEEWAARLQLSRLVDLDEADEHLSVATRLADELDLPQLRYGVLLEAGRRARDRGALSEAQRMFDRAIAVVEDVRSHIGDAAVRTSFLEGRTAGYHELLTTTLVDDTEANRLTAFELAERSRARTLTDMMTGHVVSRPEIAGAGSASGGTGVAELEADLAACYSALLRGGSDVERERRLMVQRRATDLETALQRARLETAAEEGTMLRPASRWSTVALPTHDEQVVEYHVADNRLIAFVWSGGELRVVSALPTLDEARHLVESWVRHGERHQLAATLPDGATAALTAAANGVLGQLWIRLFAPVAEHLRPGGELLVVPYGPLHTVPFHALPAPDGCIGETWTVSVAPSHAVARLLRGRRSRAGRSLVIGVADDAAPAVDAEAATVAALLPDAELLLGDKASLEQVRSALSQPRDVVHLACHGMHRSQNPMFSSLKLADGWLTARDVMSLHLDGSLVVLSACETGRQQGDRLMAEPIGLAHSFLAVGARAVVVSLWRAHDAVTAELMADFYRCSTAGLSPAAALQHARTAALGRHPHPAAWAAFTIYGGLSTKGTS